MVINRQLKYHKLLLECAISNKVTRPEAVLVVKYFNRAVIFKIPRMMVRLNVITLKQCKHGITRVAEKHIFGESIFGHI